MILEPSLPPEADVIVVGAGITGLAAARHLSDRGSSVVVLDAAPIPPPGTRTGVPGLLLAGLSVPYPVLAQALGREPARALWEATLEERRRILAETDLVEDAGELHGHLENATDPHEADALQDAGRLLAQDGLSGRWCAPEQVREEFALSGSLGGLLDPDARLVDSGAIRAGLAARAREAGASLHGDVRVAKVLETRSGGLEVRAARGRVRSEIVLLATNDTLPRLHSFLRDKFVTLRLIHAVLRLRDTPLPRVSVSLRNGTVTWTPVGPSTVLAGAVLPPARPPGASDREPVDELARHLRHVPLPLENARALGQRQGLEAFPCDGLPLVGRLPGRGRWLVAGGYGGRGLVLGHLAGRALANALLDAKVSPALEPLTPRRFL